MKNPIVISVTNASTAFPCELLIWVLFVKTLEDARRETGSSNVTSLGNHFDFVSNGNKIAVVLKGSSMDDAIRCLKAMKANSLQKRSFCCGTNVLSDDWDLLDEENRWCQYTDGEEFIHKIHRTYNPCNWDYDDEMPQSSIEEGERMSERAFGMHNINYDAAEAELRYRSKVYSTSKYDGDNDDYRSLQF